MDAAGLLQLLFSGRGRIGRVAYFLGIAIALVVMVGPVLIAIYKKAPREVSPILITFVLLGAYMLGALIVKRLHDTDTAGAWGVIGLPALLMLGHVAPGFSVAALIALLGVGVVAGTPGENRYGEAPLGLLSVGAARVATPIAHGGAAPTVAAPGTPEPIAPDDGEPPPVGSKFYEHGRRRVIIYPDGNVRARNQLGWHSFASLDAYLDFVGENANAWARNARPIAGDGRVVT